MRRITVETVLKAPPDAVRAALLRPELLHHVAAPVLTFRPVDPPFWPLRWAPGDHLVAMRLVGVLPIGRQVISISFPSVEPPKFQVRDNGHSALVTRWDHLITIAPHPQGTHYVDQVEVEAGWRTPVVAAIAKQFYRHRQRRWVGLVANGLTLAGDRAQD